MNSQDASRLISEIKSEVAKAVVGQHEVVEETITALLCQGHVLLVGVPGLAKTLLVKTIAATMDLSFSRIQFTPDLMPADITGTEIFTDDPHKGRGFSFLKGPVFANVILADEINRTPPKTQAALLQSMQELQITAAGKTYSLDRPFFVLATQNPIEQEGTYPLPEAQLDRFMFETRVGYPSADDEVLIVKQTTSDATINIKSVITAKEIIAIQQLVRTVPVADHVVRYAVELARHTRPGQSDTPDFIRKWVAWGAGPRAAQYLTLGAKAHALMRGAQNATVDDVRAMAFPVLRHRVVPNFAAGAEGIDSESIISNLLTDVKAPTGRM